MWTCGDCGCVFEEPERHNYFECHGNGIYEPMCELLCPSCGGPDLDEIDQDFECDDIEEVDE